MYDVKLKRTWRRKEGRQYEIGSICDGGRIEEEEDEEEREWKIPRMIKKQTTVFVFLQMLVDEGELLLLLKGKKRERKKELHLVPSYCALRS